MPKPKPPAKFYALATSFVGAACPAAMYPVAQARLAIYFFSVATSSISCHAAAKIKANPIPIDTAANR